MKILVPPIRARESDVLDHFLQIIFPVLFHKLASVLRLRRGDFLHYVANHPQGASFLFQTLFGDLLAPLIPDTVINASSIIHHYQQQQ